MGVCSSGPPAMDSQWPSLGDELRTRRPGPDCPDSGTDEATGRIETGGAGFADDSEINIALSCQDQDQ